MRALPATSAARTSMSARLLTKLHAMGVISSTASLAKADDVTVAAFCRRRLPVVMVRLRLSETLREALTLIEGGHVRVGPEVVKDGAFLVTRSLEDFVTWVDSSKIKRQVMRYNNKVRRAPRHTLARARALSKNHASRRAQLDDYDLLGA